MADVTSAAAPEPRAVSIQIDPIDVRTIDLRIVGTSPLIVHAWSEKAKKQMRDKQMKKPKQARDAKDPWVDFCDSLYWLSKKPKSPTEKDVAKAVFGFPAVGFKSAAVAACRFTDGVKMTEARGAFHVDGEFVTIVGSVPRQREDMVKVGMGTADLRYRGEFSPWEATLQISYNAAILSVEQIVNLFNLAGFGVGCGEWRPDRDGGYGRFKVA